MEAPWTLLHWRWADAPASAQRQTEESRKIIRAVETGEWGLPQVGK